MSHQARALLEADLDSLEKLEVMRYLRSAARPVTRAALVGTLSLERDAAAELLRELASAALVDLPEDGAVRLGPRATRDATVDELMQLYDEDRPLVVTALSSMAMERIRSMAVRTFGEALVIRKKPSSDDEEP